SHSSWFATTASDTESARATLHAHTRGAHVEERELLHLDVALLRQVHGRSGFANEAPVREVLARRGHALDVEILLEVRFDLGARAHLADLAQILDHWREQLGRAPRHVVIDRVQR